MLGISSSRQRSVLHHMLLIAATCLAPSLAEASPPVEMSPVVIAALTGEVQMRSGGASVKPSTGMVVRLPASIRTGSTGSIELRQGKTIINASANSQLDIPISSDPAETLDRIIQASGNVYYDVAKRAARKLQVETPYLVAVIKGTRFNVSATDVSATLSLLEGLIELRTGNGSDVVEISTGQIGTASAQQPRVRVMRMDTGEIIRAGRPPVSADSQGPAVGGVPAAREPDAFATAAVAVSNNIEASLTAVLPSAASVSPGSSVASRVIVSNAGPSVSDRGNSVLALESLAYRSNAGGNGNGNGNGNSGSNAGGNGNGNGNSGSNAGGNGNGNGNSGSNAGGNGNGNGNSGSNAGGNGNANSNVTTVPAVVQVIQDLVARGNGNGNAGSNSSAGGNGNGNGNSGAGGKGNGKP